MLELEEDGVLYLSSPSACRTVEDVDIGQPKAATLTRRKQ